MGSQSSIVNRISLLTPLIIATSDSRTQNRAPSNIIIWCPGRRMVTTRQFEGERSKENIPHDKGLSLEKDSSYLPSIYM